MSNIDLIFIALCLMCSLYSKTYLLVFIVIAESVLTAIAHYQNFPLFIISTICVVNAGLVYFLATSNLIKLAYAVLILYYSLDFGANSVYQLTNTDWIESVSWLIMNLAYDYFMYVYYFSATMILIGLVISRDGGTRIHNNGLFRGNMVDGIADRNEVMYPRIVKRFDRMG